MYKTTRLWIGFSFSLGLTIPSTIAATAWQPVKPFQADYQAYFKGTAVGHGSRTLKALGNGHFQATSDAKVLGGIGVSYHELSQFSYQKNRIISEGFSREKRVFLGSSKIVGRPDGRGGLFVKSDAKRQHIRSGNWGNTLDASAFQIQFQNDVKNGRETFRYHYVDGDEIKDYQFKIDGRQTITVPAGTYQTIRLKRINQGSRETYMWLAPKLDYQLIKLQVKRHGKNWSSMALTKIQVK
ncbi:DUF3108 domain-containing protein [Celerinatantimonas yamalensis]|uniref:DUF3108 domain-containing protein n=1 Tax=Celerinatantimonas yamalensis TaxID=559956 RepID=A0ABW9G2K3_9GAMM